MAYFEQGGTRKPLYWVGTSLDDLSAFPVPVKQRMGFVLHQAQLGGKHIDAKPLKGFGGAGVLEVVARHDGDTYRAIYTVCFPDAVYVLHAFQKKATRGARTPQKEIDLVKRRLQEAEKHHAKHKKQ